jgi:hypothetical protein
MNCPNCARPVEGQAKPGYMLVHPECQAEWDAKWELIKPLGDDEPQRPEGTSLKKWLFPEIHETWEPKRVGGRT